jgi:hypothetical protein
MVEAVYVAFGSQMHDSVWPVLNQNSVNSHTVTNINLLKTVTPAAAYVGQVFQITCIGELVQVNNSVIRILDNMANNG